MFVATIVVSLFVLFCLSLLSTSRRRAPKGFRLVPGPKGLPVIGNTLEVPLAQPEKKFLEWSKEFGELYRIQMGWNEWVFVNSDIAAKEIFDKQSAVTSSRPRMPVSSDLVSGGVVST